MYMTYTEVPKTPDVEIEYENEILEAHGFKLDELRKESHGFDDPFDALSGDDLIGRAVASREVASYEDTLIHPELTIYIDRNLKSRAEALERSRTARATRRAKTQAAKAEKARELSTPEAAQARQAQFEEYIAPTQRPEVTVRQEDDADRPTIAVKKVVVVSEQPQPSPVAEAIQPAVRRSSLRRKVAVGMAGIGLIAGTISGGVALKTHQDAGMKTEEASGLGQLGALGYATGEYTYEDGRHEQFIIADKVDNLETQAAEKYDAASKYAYGFIGGMLIASAGFAGMATKPRRKN